MVSFGFSAGTCWIWGGDEVSPRNAWRCFRHDVPVPRELERATLLITADSRYHCRING